MNVDSISAVNALKKGASDISTSKDEPKSSSEAGSSIDKGASQASQETVEETVVRLNEYVQSLNRGLEFSVDADTKDVVVKVIDRDTKEVVRQFPPEDMLRLRKSIDDYLNDSGFLVEEKV